MNNDKQDLLRTILAQHGNQTELFARLEQEYRATADSGKLDLYLAVTAELVTAQAVVRALTQSG